MKKITGKERRSLEDSIWRETISKKRLKEQLMLVNRYPARAAKKEVQKIYNDAVQYWAYEDVY